MEWYWWILIGIGLIGIIILKVKVGGMWLKRQKEKQAQRDQYREMED